ncbi:hypothetical protein K402DRAFT_243988 [Aulographum hederae CBS 113979]|uniref:Uncharacterized protein n=1 Tax=Aulographum hederae CBS 113979 TaxID=1176131 RepID=A0A6G1HA97_9PEZI|nr:hypothetical protein K402DRAFT_243988 [Aulographum hederae CBS 113979]
MPSYPHFTYYLTQISDTRLLVTSSGLFDVCTLSSLERSSFISTNNVSVFSLHCLAFLKMGAAPQTMMNLSLLCSIERLHSCSASKYEHIHNTSDRHYRHQSTSVIVRCTRNQKTDPTRSISMSPFPLSYSPLILPSHTPLSYSPLILPSHTPLSYSPLILPPILSPSPSQPPHTHQHNTPTPNPASK